MARRRFGDASRVGRSKVCGYVVGESAADRHARRLATALANDAGLKAWLEKNGWSLAISNEGHHWRMVKGGTVVEWWPSSAKCVVNQNWRGGVHCHDGSQVVVVLERLSNRKGT